MKITDLRIGNFISINFGNRDDGKVITVDGVSDCEIYNEEHGYSPCNEFNPIPLTEQWLLDLGLEKYTGRYGVYYKHYALDGFRVWLPRDIYGWGYTVGRKDFETGDTYWVKNEVRYVHQLQNLYFALTQEELILKGRIEQ